jgi:hypothetical protein
MAFQPVFGQFGSVAHQNDPVTIVDYPSYISIMEWSGAISTAFGVSPILTFPPIGTGVSQAYGTGTTDDSLAINAALLAIGLGGGGEALYFPNGTYLVSANAIVNTYAVPMIFAQGATFTGTYASAFQAALTPYSARAVVTTLDAYGGSGTGTLTETTAASGLGTQDGVATLAVNDIVFIPAGLTNLTAAKDAGPWQIANLGSATVKWVLIRPSWWRTGSTMPLGAVIAMGGEGTAYQGHEWKSFAAEGTVIGTSDPAFYIDNFTTAVTLTTGFVKLGPSQTFPGLRSTTISGITFTPTNFNGASLTVSYRTGAYSSGGSATAAGAMGTSTVSITALVAAGTFNTNDVGTGLLTITNW